jgi:hypothetical protein
MTITEIIRNGKGTAGSNHAWKVDTYYPSGLREGWKAYSLTHYGTFMLAWARLEDRSQFGRATKVLDYTIGHGSKSDQGGMNTAFRALGAPYYYSRAGGAEIRETSK